MLKQLKHIYLFTIATSLLVISACSSPSSVDVQQLNGYWSISSVELEDGTRKDFKISTTVDFIEVTDTSGVRKKVNPKLDGSFITSDNFETFLVKKIQDSIQLQYRTEFDQWNETVLSTTDSTFSVLNKDQKIYHYKRFTPFNFKSN